MVKVKKGNYRGYVVGFYYLMQLLFDPIATYIGFYHVKFTFAESIQRRLLRKYWFDKRLKHVKNN